MTVDRFTNAENPKLKRFNSKFLCPWTESVNNAFSQDWSRESNLLVPQIKDILQVLKKIEIEKAEQPLIVPFWQSAPFWPFLIKNRQFLPFLTEFEILSIKDQNKLVQGNN